MIAILGIVSALLIAFRIIEPPVFYVESTIRTEGAVQLPMVLALLSALGIAFGGLWARAEEGNGRVGLRARRHSAKERLGLG